MALNLVIVKGSNGGKFYDPVGFQRLDQPPHALRERFGVRFEVLVVDVDSVQVVVFDYGCERRNGVGNPGIDGSGVEVSVASSDAVSSETEGYFDV